MNCKICGANSGKYLLCYKCNKLKESGEIIKCSQCGNWHYANAVCTTEAAEKDQFIYELKPSIMTESEKQYFAQIKTILPEGYLLQPQVNLASAIERTDGAAFQNELFRNIDFMVTDLDYKPIMFIEINDPSHNDAKRKERDKKVKEICEEAGIPILTLWTSYGISPDYIQKRIQEILASLPVERISHHAHNEIKNADSSKEEGCYIATCVYGSYDCPPVWILRRFRDFTLKKLFWGRIFIRIYYIISPKLVQRFGKANWFHKIWGSILERLIVYLQQNGIENTPYEDGRC